MSSDEEGLFEGMNSGEDSEVDSGMEEVDEGELYDIPDIQQRKYNDMKKIMEVFSGLTQSTLSAFHKAGVDDEVIRKMEKIRSLMHDGLEEEILVNMTVNKQKMRQGEVIVEREFRSGYRDEVNIKEAYKPVFKSKGLEEIKNLNIMDIMDIIKDKERSSSYITKFNKAILKSSEWKRIERDSERNFFNLYEEESEQIIEES